MPHEPSNAQIDARTAARDALEVALIARDVALDARDALDALDAIDDARIALDALDVAAKGAA